MKKREKKKQGRKNYTFIYIYNPIGPNVSQMKHLKHVR